MRRVAPENDVVIVEIGGTVGDIESLPFLEAIRQFRHDVGRENAIFVHLTLVPYIAAAGELKTKPTQHSVRELMQIGIQPDILICRTERPLSDDIKRKIALFCNVEFGAVIESRDVPIDLRDPAPLPRAGVRREGARRSFGLERPAPDLAAWREMVQRVLAPHERVRIAVVGKYTDFVDSYKSVQEALIHGGIANDVGVDITWISSDSFTDAERTARDPRGVRRPARARRLRRARRRGHGRGDPLRARERHAVLRHLPRHADGDHRVRAQRVRARRQSLVASSRRSATTR